MNRTIGLPCRQCTGLANRVASLHFMPATLLATSANYIPSLLDAAGPAPAAAVEEQAGAGEQPGQQAPVEQPDAHQEAEEAEAALWDPYEQLDPHDKGSLPIKPFRKGRKPTRRGCRAGVAPAGPSWAVHIGCACMAPSPARQGCAFAEFEGAWRAVQAQTKAARQAADHSVDAYLLLTRPADAQGPGGSGDEADGLGGESWLAQRQWSMTVLQKRSLSCHTAAISAHCTDPCAV